MLSKGGIFSFDLEVGCGYVMFQHPVKREIVVFLFWLGVGFVCFVLFKKKFAVKGI